MLVRDIPNTGAPGIPEKTSGIAAATLPLGVRLGV